MCGDADLAAHVEDWAGRAAWQTPCTDMLAEGDQQAIDLYPIRTWKNFFECGCRLFRRRRVDIPPAIRDTVNVDIDRDARLIARDAEHQVGALRADPMK